MPKQYAVLYARKYQSNQGEKTHWMHVGKAFDARNGGIDVILHVMPPFNGNGEARILIREENEADQRDQGQPRGGAHQPAQRQQPQHRDVRYRQGDVPPMPGGDEGGDDNIPF